MFLGESSIMFHMNRAKQKLWGRQVLGAVPVSGRENHQGQRQGPEPEELSLSSEEVLKTDREQNLFC